MRKVVRSCYCSKDLPDSKKDWFIAKAFRKHLRERYLISRLTSRNEGDVGHQAIDLNYVAPLEEIEVGRKLDSKGDREGTNRFVSGNLFGRIV